MESTQSLTIDQQQKGKYPKSVPYIIGNEAAERFSFYGMRSILPTFLVAQFFNPANNPALQTVAEAQANEQTHFFVALAYTMPLVGGLLADWFFGKYRVILYISLVYCLGHLTLALYEHDLQVFTFGLVMIAFGAGCIKSCVSANVGDQFTESNQHLLSKVYGWFYFSINAGSVFATLLIPIIYNKYGAAWAFGVPGILMALATLIFWLGRKSYRRVPPVGIQRNNFMFISVYALFNLGKKKKGESWLDVAKASFPDESVEGVKAVYRVLIVFAFIPIFWAMWDQNLSEWVLQATKMDRNILGLQLLPEQVQTVNPIFLLTMIPIFTYGIYPLFEKMGIKTTPLRRIGTGLFLTALSFVVIALIQQNIDNGGTPSIWWQILAYFILSAAEVLVSITGLEYAYTHSPKAMKSTMSAIWFLTVAVGNIFVSMVNSSISNKGFFAQLEGATYFWFFVGLMTAFVIVFVLVSGSIKERSFIVNENEA
jgi:POT family proton-dependent oligopeptide transporter